MKRASFEQENARNEMAENEEEVKRARVNSGETIPSGSGQDIAMSQAVAINWNQSKFAVTPLEGHSSLVCAVDINDNFIVTAGVDTTVRIWDRSTYLQIHSMRGHSDTITSVSFLPKHDSCLIANTLNIISELLVVSGSLDCHIKVWHVESGTEVKSIYTFNGITKLIYINGLQHVITATEGGKLEVFNITQNEHAYSVQAFDDAITSLTLEDDIVSAASVQGIKIWQLYGNKLESRFDSSAVKSKHRKETRLGSRISMVVMPTKIYVGDEHPDLKVLMWAEGTGSIRYMPNNESDRGMTDAVCCKGRLLFSSCYDPASDEGYVNVRDAESETYLCSLKDRQPTGRILCIAAMRNEAKISFVTGGKVPKLWEMLPFPNGKKNIRHLTVCSAVYNERYSRKIDLTVELLCAEKESSDSECDEVEIICDKAPNPPDKKWFCSIM